VEIARSNISRAEAASLSEPKMNERDGYHLRQNFSGLLPVKKEPQARARGSSQFFQTSGF
jgi:hypothetical protein